MRSGLKRGSRGPGGAVWHFVVGAAMALLGASPCLARSLETQASSSPPGTEEVALEPVPSPSTGAAMEPVQVAKLTARPREKKAAAPLKAPDHRPLHFPDIQFMPAVEATREAETRWKILMLAQTGAAVYRSDARMMGGAGGGVGVRAVWKRTLTGQLDFNYMMGLGNTVQFRGSFGVQLPRTWSPAVQLTLAALGGERLSFLTEDRPVAIAGPATAVGLSLAPLRFTTPFGQVSFLEVVGGVGYDRPSLGLAGEVRLLEVASLF